LSVGQNPENPGDVASRQSDVFFRAGRETDMDQLVDDRFELGPVLQAIVDQNLAGEQRGLVIRKVGPSRGPPLQAGEPEQPFVAGDGEVVVVSHADSVAV